MKQRSHFIHLSSEFLKNLYNKNLWHRNTKDMETIY